MTTLLGGADPATARSRLTADELNTIELFKESTPSVVYITNLASKCVSLHNGRCGIHLRNVLSLMLLQPIRG